MEQAILNVAHEFAKELMRLDSIKPGSNADITFSIQAGLRYVDSKYPKMILSCHFYDGKNFATVQAASLGALMDEVHRRLGFADKQAFAIEAAQGVLTGIQLKGAPCEPLLGMVKGDLNVP
jgi:hypothetical protein